MAAILAIQATQTAAYERPSGNVLAAAKKALEDNIFDGNKEMLGMTIRLSKWKMLVPWQQVYSLLAFPAFHDCVGGCNGAINAADHENAGLDIITTKLEAVYQAGFTDVLSRADFWAYAGYVAIWNGIWAANRGCKR